MTLTIRTRRARCGWAATRSRGCTRAIALWVWLGVACHHALVPVTAPTPAPTGASAPELVPRNRCGRDFEALRRIIEHGYAGWHDKHERLGTVHIDGATAHVIARAAAIGDEDVVACTAALRPWLAMFDDDDLALFELGERPVHGDDAAVGPDAVQFVPISARTVVLRVPSFEDPAPIAAMVEAHRLEIRRAERLVLDLRGNAGGSAAAWAPLMAFAQSLPYTVVGFDVRVSEDNAAAWARAAEELHADAADGAARLRAVAMRMRRASGPWLELTPDRVETREVVRLPRYVDIVHDGACARACEQFVLEASASDKVTTFGSHTAGVLDYADVRAATLPSGVRVLTWPTSRSRRLPSAPVDGVGLLPEVAIEPAALRSLDADGLARRVAAPR